MRHIPRLSPSVLCLPLLALVVLSILVRGGALSEAAAPAEGVPSGVAAARVRQSYGSLPLSFEPNRGQADARAQFLARNSAYSLYLTADEMALALRDSAGTEGARERTRRPSVLRIKLLGASGEARAEGLGELPGKSNYLVGRDPSRWRTNVPNYARVKYEGVYPGVDVVYYGTQRQLEYDFNLAPGADARLIRLRVEGAKNLRVEENGDLVLPTPAGEVRQHAPLAFQEVEGVRQTVACRYVKLGDDRVGFELGAYDRTRPLVIDPVLSYSTFLGGSGYDDANSVAVDALGNAYVTGSASSFDFPVTPDAYQQNRRGGAHQETYDAFVTKLNFDGTALVYSTFLGGYGDDHAASIALDSDGNAYVAGHTDSNSFPATAGAYRTAGAGGDDVFVAKLNAAGTALVYATLLGGSNFDYPAQLALGSNNEAYVGGRTQSADFPVTPGAWQTQPLNLTSYRQKGFITKLNAAGSGLVFSTFVGGSEDDMVEALAVAKGLDDSVYVTGRTSSRDFPVTWNCFQPEHAPGDMPYDVFVTRLNAEGNSALFSTYLGGTGEELSRAIAVDASGAAYVGGLTDSASLPVTPGAFQASRTPSGTPEVTGDAFVAKLSPDGHSLLYLTYFGGAGNDDVQALAVDASGAAYVVGQTSSPSLPAVADGLQPSYGGGSYDGFFFKLNETGTAVPYATYVGREQWDAVRDVALDPQGGVYMTGTTWSQYFPTTAGVLQPEPGENAKSDGFVMKLDFGTPGLRIKGRVTNEFGNGLRDVYVSVAGSYNSAVSTDAEGYYAITGLPAGANVTVSANRYGFDFAPGQVTFTNLDKNETVDFNGPAPLVIQGTILGDMGYGVHVPVNITSADGAINFTNEYVYDGRYHFIVPAGGTYTVTPGPSFDYTFAPPSQTFNNLTADQTFDFQAQRPPRIFGQVNTHDYYSSGLAGVRVTLTGPTLPEPLVQTSDQWGYFFFENLERGATYTVTPSDPLTNRPFAPPAQTVENIQGWEFVNFRALDPLSINGRVADADDRPVPCTVTLTGTVNAQVELDEWGYFHFPNLPPGGDYTVTVTKPGSLYTFAPPSRTVTNLQQMQVFEFEALPPLRIYGHVSDANYNGLRATVTLTGTVNATTQAEEWGSFSFENLPRGGDYTVTVSYQLYTFEPPSRSVTNAQADMIFPFEALPPLRIFGGVSGENGLGVAGVTVTLTGAVSRTATTDEWGGFNFTDLPRGGDYVVTPAHDLYDFTPQSRAFPAMSRDEVAGFEGVLRRFTLSGRVRGETGSPLAGVNVLLGGSAEEMRQTDAQGNYAFNNLAVGRPYTVTAARAGYSFAPATHNVNDPRGDQTANFDASHLTYTISGRVTDQASGAALAGATLTLSGGSSATAQADADGRYAFAGLPSEGDYTVHVSHPHFGFSYPTLTYHDLLSDMPADFAGTRLKRQISGRVTDAAGAALSGVNVTLGGASASTAQTDSFGDYLFNDLPSGLDYTVTAARTHYTISPATRAFDALSADATADFTATLLRHRITGRVVDANGNGFAGALVNLIGHGGVTTDATGDFSFENLPAGQPYTLEPSRQFYSFAPTRASWLALGADQDVTFTATLNTYSLGGRVTEGANGVAGLTVNLTGTRTAAAQTDAQGNYLFTSLPANGTYSVAPAASAVYSFTPASKSFNTLPYNETANFAAARRLYTVGGSLLDACGGPIAGVTVALTRDGVTVNTQTDASGLYTFASVQAGYDYAVAPAGSAYTFTPPSYSLPGLSATQAASFTGRPPTATANVFALADLYVRGGSNAGSYYGTSTQLITRLASQGKDTYESYLKFNVGQPCTVGSVKLRLYGQLSATANLPVAVYGVPSTTWTETGTNWNNRPAAGALLSTVNVTGTTAAWYEWDVTDYVRAELAAGRSTVAFALKSTTVTSYQATFSSRQATGTNAPRLAVTTP